MVLRFKSEDGRYVAFNAAKRIFVTDKQEVDRNDSVELISVSNDNFDHVWLELQFNGYDWVDSLGAVDALWSEIPTF